MSDPLKIGVEFSSKGAQEIGTAYEAAMKRVVEAAKKADAELANLMGQGREESLRRRGADMRLKSLIETFEKTKALGQQQKELTEALKAQAQELNATTHAQLESSKATEAATNTTKAQKDAIKGLSHVFPELSIALRLLINPITAGAAAIGVFVSRIRSMAAERVAVKAFGLEIENLGKQTGSFRDTFVADWTEMTNAVAGFEKAMNAATKAIADNREINSDQDDALLQGKLQAIDQSGETPTNKAILKSRAIRDAGRAKELGAISAAEADAAKFSGDAKNAREQQFFKQAEAEGMGKNIADLAKSLQASQKYLAQQQKFAERNLPRLDAEIAADRAAGRAPGENVLHARNMRQTLQEARDMVAADEARLADATGARDRVVGEARGFGATAIQLDEQAGAARTRAATLRQRFGNVRPILESNENSRLGFMQAGDDFQAKEAAAQRYIQQARQWQSMGGQNAGPLIQAMQQFTGASTDNFAILTQLVNKALKDLEKLKQQFGGSAGSATLPR